MSSIFVSFDEVSPVPEILCVCAYVYMYIMPPLWIVE